MAKRKAMSKIRRNNLQRVRRLYKRMEARGYIIPENVRDLKALTTQKLKTITEGYVTKYGQFKMGKHIISGWEGVVYEKKVRDEFRKTKKLAKDAGIALRTPKKAIAEAKAILEDMLDSLGPMSTTLRKIIDFYKDEIGEDLLILRISTIPIKAPTRLDFMIGSDIDMEAAYANALSKWYKGLADYLRTGKATPDFKKYDELLKEEYNPYDDAEMINDWWGYDI